MPASLMVILNYFHDIAVALLASNILVVYYLGRWLDKHPQRDRMIENVFAKLSRVTWGALTFVILFGAVRAYFFMEMEWNPAAGKGQIASLVVKHVVLVAITLFGILAHMKYQKKYGKKTT